MEGVRVENVVPFTSSLHSVAFVNVKFHLPGEFPLGYRIKVSLQKGGIAFGFYAAVEDAIISKETDCTIDGFVSTLGHTREDRMGGEDCDPSETTLCNLPCRKCWIQLCVDPLMPYQSSLYCRRL